MCSIGSTIIIIIIRILIILIIIIIIIIVITLFMSQVYLAEHRGSTNWRDRKSNQMKCWFQFGEREKPEYKGKNLSEQSREPTNSTHT